MDEAAATAHGSTSERDRRDLEALGPPVLAELIRTTALGVALLDADWRWLYVNPAGCRIMHADLGALVGRPAPFVPADDAVPVDPVDPGELRTRFIDVAVGDGSTAALEYADNGIATGQESRIAVMFRDVTESRHRERWLAAFARTASSLAYAGSLQRVLDQVAADVLPPTGAVASAIVLIDPRTHAIRLGGTAGHRDDYLERLEKCRQLGAPLATLEAFESRQPAVRRNMKAFTEDPRYEPVRDTITDAAWSS